MVSFFIWSLFTVSIRVPWVCNPAHYLYAKETLEEGRVLETQTIAGPLHLANGSSHLTSLPSILAPPKGIEPLPQGLEDPRAIPLHHSGIDL
jgi:hypothetical protein